MILVNNKTDVKVIASDEAAEKLIEQGFEPLEEAAEKKQPRKTTKKAS